MRPFSLTLPKMITNVPSGEDLNKAALRLYFTAWTSLMEIATDFDEEYPKEDEWSQEKAEYLRSCQADLQSCCTLIQQSNELALKARIARSVRSFYYSEMTESLT